MTTIYLFKHKYVSRKKKISFFFNSILLSILFRSYSSFSEKGTLTKVKDYFVLDSYSYLISGSEHTLDRNRGEYFFIISTNFKSQFKFPFCTEISSWINPINSITNPLCILIFLTIHPFVFAQPCIMVIHL